MTQEEAIKYIEEYKENTGISYEQIAKEMNISGSTLSSFRGKTYKTPHTIINLIVKFKKSQEKKVKLATRDGFVETSVAKKILDLMEYASLTNRFCYIYGDPGVGKTETMLEYCKRDLTAIRIVPTEVDVSLKGINTLLCTALGSMKKRTNIEAKNFIINKLKNSNRLVIVDEAQNLTLKTIDYLRQIIVDKDGAGCGLILSGNDGLHTRIKGEEKMRQIESRTGLRKEVRLSDTKLSDIKMFFDGLEDGEYKFLHSISKGEGCGIRTAIDLYKFYLDVKSESKVKGLDLMVHIAREEMGIGL